MRLIPPRGLQQTHTTPVERKRSKRFSKCLCDLDTLHAAASSLRRRQTGLPAKKASAPDRELDAAGRRVIRSIAIASRSPPTRVAHLLVNSRCELVSEQAIMLRRLSSRSYARPVVAVAARRSRITCGSKESRISAGTTTKRRPQAARSPDRLACRLDDAYQLPERHSSASPSLSRSIESSDSESSARNSSAS